MQNNALHYLSDVLFQEGYSVLPDQVPSLNHQKIDSSIKEQIQEVYEDLNGKGDCTNIPNLHSAGLDVEGSLLLVDGPLSFNRYRAITLRSELYQQATILNLENWKRYARAFEKECIKAGSQDGVWTNAKAEQHFGRAEEAGDFFGNGGSGWKLYAFQEFLDDVMAVTTKRTIKRISVFDNILIDKKLFKLQDLLISRKEENKKYLISYVSRQIQLPKKDENKEA